MTAKKKSAAQFHVVLDSSSYASDDACEATLYRRDGNTKPWRVVYQAIRTGRDKCTRAENAVVAGYQGSRSKWSDEAMRKPLPHSIGPRRGGLPGDLANRAANQMLLRQHRPTTPRANPVNTKPYKAALCDRCEAEYHWSRIGSQCDCGKPLRSVELFYDRDGILREKKRSASTTKKKPIRKPNPVYESLTPNPLEFKERGVKAPFKLMQPHVQGNPRRRSLRK